MGVRKRSGNGSLHITYFQRKQHRRERAQKERRSRTHHPDQGSSPANLLGRSKSIRENHQGEDTAKVQKKQTKTGFEQFYRYKPTLSDIHVFGCVAIVWRRPDQRNKLESRALPCIYLGPQGKGHRFYNVLTSKVFQASTAIWAEKSFGIQNAKKLCEQIGLKSWIDEDDDELFYDEDDVSTECIDVEKELSKTNLPPPTDPEHLFLNPLITNVLDTPEAPEPLDHTPARRPKRERYPDAPNPIPVARIEDNDDDERSSARPDINGGPTRNIASEYRFSPWRTTT